MADSEEIAAMREMWIDGYSYTEIGIKFGRSKGAIAGIAYRNDFPNRSDLKGKVARSSPTPTPRLKFPFQCDPRILEEQKKGTRHSEIAQIVSALCGRSITAKCIKQRLWYLHKLERSGKKPVASHAVTSAQPAQIPVTKADLVAKISAKPAALVRIIRQKPVQAPSQRECQWPVGTPGRSGFHFCCDHAVAGKPYCLQHCKMAYIPDKNREAA